jgi:hypothetical protein
MLKGTATKGNRPHREHPISVKASIARPALAIDVPSQLADNRQVRENDRLAWALFTRVTRENPQQARESYGSSLLAGSRRLGATFGEGIGAEP